ncbi:hypothetical protein ACFV06_34970 [Streptomyces sp. NPDC059618]|uniref:hypothetical protein n=1 Tax=Streptomyces sp. NPDC059618 TaxID=3346887 RepID=UPI0036C89789
MHAATRPAKVTEVLVPNTSPATRRTRRHQLLQALPHIAAAAVSGAVRAWVSRLPAP